MGEGMAEKLTRKDIKAHVERILAMQPKESTAPKCDEDGAEMERYERALDTGKDGWRCPECGWSMDDE